MIVRTNKQYRFALPSIQLAIAALLYWWDWRLGSPDNSISSQLIIGLNFPAAVVITPLAYLTTDSDFTWMNVATFALAIVGFWYMVGRGIDNGSLLRTADKGVTRVLLIVLVLFAISLVWARNEVGRSSTVPILSWALVVWLLLGTVVCAVRIYHARSL
jgi:hypothetical protein